MALRLGKFHLYEIQDGTFALEGEKAHRTHAFEDTEGKRILAFDRRPTGEAWDMIDLASSTFRATLFL